MKTCAACAAVAGDEAPTCANCGEASWTMSPVDAPLEPVALPEPPPVTQGSMWVEAPPAPAGDTAADDDVDEAPAAEVAPLLTPSTPHLSNAARRRMRRP